MEAVTAIKTKEGFDLNHEEKTVFWITYTEVNRLVNEYFDLGRVYNILAEDELSNDILKQWTIDPDQSDWDKKQLNDMLTGEFGEGYDYYDGHLLFRELCRLEIIPQGIYIIEICW